MTAPDSVRLRRLSADDRWGYGIYTFPALRHLLQHLDDASVVAVAADDAGGGPVGLALGTLSDEDGVPVCELASLFVTAARRRQGIGRRLLELYSEVARERGAQALKTTYMSGQAGATAFAALLAEAGWDVPETRMLVVRATLESIARAPWIRRQPLADNMSIVPWVELTEADRAALAASQQAESWIPADLYPFDHEAHCEPVTSLALKVDGQVVGWAINHRVADILRYTCAYMHPRLHRSCRILLLYNEAVARMPQAGFDTGMWTVPVWHGGHAAFARRWMAPYAVSFQETRCSRRALGVIPG